VYDITVDVCQVSGESAARRDDVMQHQSQALFHSHLFPLLRSSPWQLPDRRLPGRQAAFPRQRRRPAVRAQPLPRPGLPPVRRRGSAGDDGGI